MKVRLPAGLLIVLVAAALGAGTASATVSAGSTTRYYLALGDSLAAGYQPLANGGGANTTQGYVYRVYDYERTRIPGLKLFDIACPGDTTSSLLTGRGNLQAAKLFRCDRLGGSQLAAAETFLHTHHERGEVALVTIDIGANDVDGCASSAPAQIIPCVTDGIQTIAANTPKILAGLRRAAAPGTRLVAMNLYDPVLDDWFLPATNPLQALGEGSTVLLKEVNTAIQSADRRNGFRTADVADAFHSYDSIDMVPYNGIEIPKNVAYVCAWTWACSTPPVGPNIHANALGYGVIARAFEQVTGRL